jgi:hypothetical protein
MFQTKYVEKIKRNVLGSKTFFPGNLAVYEILWTNMVERGRPQMAIWSMPLHCWIHKATYTHSQYVIFIAFPL